MNARAATSLHVQRRGSGPDVVMLHGWGMHSGVFEELSSSLARRYTVTTVDLPGHGRSSHEACPENVAEMADSVLKSIPRKAAIVGWSLGGMVALELAMRSRSDITALVLLAATPRFVIAEDWPHATGEKVFDDIAASLTSDWRGTLDRFLALQALGTPGAREQVRRLRERLFEHGEPHPRALQVGLEILRRTDLRAGLAAVECPALLVLGERDRLVPAQVAGDLQARVAGLRAEVIRSAGHAPFVSHSEQCEEIISAFLAEALAGTGAEGGSEHDSGYRRIPD